MKILSYFEHRDPLAARHRGCRSDSNAVAASERDCARYFPTRFAGMVVRKAANMANHLGIPLIGLIENMSHVIDTPLLGHIPFDTRITTLCDQGKIECYFGDEFEKIVDRMMEFIS